MHKIKGVFCASLTPLNEDFSINKKLFLNYCNNLMTQGLDGLGIFGTTGEANSFNSNEKLDATNYLLENNFNPQNLIIGTGLCSIKESVALTKAVSQLNVKAVLVLPAFYYKNVSQKGVIEYYRRIVEEVGDADLHYILYNIPQMSGITIDLKTIETLVKLLPNNIVAMKESSGNRDFMLKTIKEIPSLSVFSGSDSLAVEACRNGGVGAITSTSNLSAKLLCYLLKNYEKNFSSERFKLLRDLQDQIRDTLFTQEPISTMKALLSIIHKEDQWNRVNAPLQIISDPNNNSSISRLMELMRKMDQYLADA